MNRAEFHYRRQGDEGLRIYWLHGFLESSEMFEVLWPELPGHRHAAPDLPGHGYTPAHNYTLADCAKWIADDAADDPFAVIGHSMGGYVGCEMLASSNCRGLLLLHSSAAPDSDAKKADRMQAVSVMHEDFSRFCTNLIPKLFTDAFQQSSIARVEVYTAMALKTPVLGGIAGALAMRGRRDNTLTLKQRDSHKQLHYVLGRFDSVLPEERMVRELEITQPDKTSWLENSAHMGFEEETPVCLDAIKSFLKTLSY